MRLLITLTFLTGVLGCEKQREQVDKFVFDSKQISTKDVYKYEFDGNGKIKTTYSTTFMYIAGVLFDSATYVKHHEYNEKGQIAKIFDSIDSTWQIKFYNDVDSLIADYTINNYGDTTRMTTVNYFEGKTHRRCERILNMTLPADFENIKKEDLRVYDTLSFKTEFVYEGERHTKSLSLDKDGAVIEEVHLIYENGRKAKTVTYSFILDRKYLKETTTYGDNKTGELDALTIGTQGDTIGFRKTIFQDQDKITVNHMGQLNMQDISYYDKTGRHIGTVLLDLNEGVKTVHSYTYDDKGNVVEEANYRERINNAR